MFVWGRSAFLSVELDEVKADGKAERTEGTRRSESLPGPKRGPIAPRLTGVVYSVAAASALFRKGPR